MKHFQNNVLRWWPLCFASAGLYLALAQIANATESGVVPPVHGRMPGTPTSVSISSTNGVASVSHSPFIDVDGDEFKSMSYQWSLNKSASNIASTNPTYNLIPGQEVFVRVAALAKTGFPTATQTSRWSEWSPGYKVDIFTFGTCNSNNFVYTDRISTRAYVYVSRIYLNGEIIGNENNANDLNDSVTLTLNKPIKSFNIWQSINTAYSPTEYYLEYMELTYMDDTKALIANSPGSDPFKTNQWQIPSPFSASGKYAKGGKVVAIAACDHSYPESNSRWQGYTGIRFALEPVL